MLDLYTADIAEIQRGLDHGDFTSVQLTKAYIARIAQVNDEVRAVFCVNAKALQEAARLDEERKTGKASGPLHGIPILLKDNIVTQHQDGMDTTAGSLALKGYKFEADAHIVKLLKEKGAIILGKLALSEWAYFRSGDTLPSGWSAIGGQCTNPYFKSGVPSGSSSGSGVAATLALAAATIGTETSGSIVSPASVNNCVGLRPTVGLVSRTGIVPVSPEHDTAGPMTRTVADAALLMDAIVGVDQKDQHTLGQPTPKPSYASYLRKDALRGKRLGIPINYLREWGGKWETFDNPSSREYMRPAFHKAVKVLRDLGAEVVEIDIENVQVLVGQEYDKKDPDFSQDMRCEFKDAIDEFLGSLPGCKVGSLAELIAFNKATPEETPPSYEGQSTFDKAEATLGRKTPSYSQAKARSDAAGALIESSLRKHDLDAFIVPGVCHAGWAKAGYPQIILPLGFSPEDTEVKQLQDHPACQTYHEFPGRPFGITFAGSAWSEGTLISCAYAFEQATHYRDQGKPYKEAMPTAQIE